MAQANQSAPRPIELGDATIAALAVALSGGGGGAPSKLTTTTRLPVWASGQVITTAATSAKTTAVTGTEVMVSVSADCWINIGAAASVVATAGAGSMFLAKGGPYTFQITSGQAIAAIQDAAAGKVSVLPVA